jgi:hypothetical protein
MRNALLNRWLALPGKNYFLTLAAAINALGMFSLGNLLADSPHGSFSTIGSEQKKAVKIVTRRDGNATRFIVQNDEFCDITMTFEMSMENLKADIHFPCTVTFPARQVTEAFTLDPAATDSPWAYSYTNYYKLGSSTAVHNDSVLYQLPYASGEKFRVTQGYNGGFSHKGSNLYATDWKMPEGTPVLAARAGVVVRTKDDSNQGGSSMKFDAFNNFVLLQHDDGTLGHYCHLQKDSARVVVGQKVNAGEWIARSGNTGFSSGPHLHFCVFKTKNGRERESLPVKFQTADEKSVTLLAGRTYKAKEFESVSARLENHGVSASLLR